MGTFSIWHWIIVLLVVLLLFGAGKIPRLMGDVAKGVKAFKKGLAEDDESGTGGDSKRIEGENATAERKKDEAASG
ncbi:twin-arginine translocase TatA/TatE family subunit [uncultured Rhodospira sp.]|uniref:twin-arginine translocase TatA/TatE family subunit n=1 Tax=uncultured Rhodospira sp. TaxID=1936189 RepID=UPI0026306B12|nr:twin-arginine translocase TatA/TatE family subunit [uncultured Rhodospira sp.]